MPSTYSPTLRLELIGQGEQDGTWGTTTNTNLGSLIEQAITGVQTITFADANYTLTAFNGLPDESRNMVLVLSGVNTNTRQLITPAVEKMYVVANNTGAGVTIKTSSGSGVTVPNGATQIVYCDGVNFALAASQTNVVAGNGISVSTSGITSTVSVNTSVTATLSDFQTLSNKTLNSPTLNTPILGTPTSGTLTNCSGLPIDGGTTGTLPVARGGTGTTTSTGSGSTVLSASPALTGTPTAPTAAPGTNTTQIATTAFVQNVAGGLGTMSTQNASSVAITGGTITGTTVNGNSVGSNASGNRTISSSGPSGGSSGDIWYQI